MKSITKTQLLQHKETGWFLFSSLNPHQYPSLLKKPNKASKFPKAKSLDDVVDVLKSRLLQPLHASDDIVKPLCIYEARRKFNLNDFKLVTLKTTVEVI